LIPGIVGLNVFEILGPDCHPICFLT
jgi:hypothetical protein